MRTDVRPNAPAVRRNAALTVVEEESRGGVVWKGLPKPVRPGPSQSDPEQPIGPTNGGLRSGAPVNSQLLLQREVLQDQDTVSAPENDKEPNDADEAGDHRFSITGSAHVPEGHQNRAPRGFGESHGLLEAASPPRAQRMRSDYGWFRCYFGTIVESSLLAPGRASRYLTGLSTIWSTCTPSSRT